MTTTQVSENSHKTIAELKKRVEQLEDLVETISRGKMAWQSTFDVITDPVMIIDEEFRITRGNRALADACDIDVRQIVGKKCYEIFAGHDAPCPNCPAQETLQGGQPGSQELDPFPKNQKHYHVSVYSMPTVEGHKEVVLHYRSVAEEKDLQTKLLQSEKMAAIGTLAGGIAHEINNPLGAILAFTQLVIAELENEHPSQSDLQEIEQATQRCRTIVKDLLNFSRQNYDEQMQAMNLNDMIEKSMGLVSINAKNKPVEIKLKLDDALKEFTGHFHKMQQVFMNFVSNGIDAMKEKGGVLEIETQNVDAKNQVILIVRDSGEGIPDDILNKIFDPYFTTKVQGEGTGLGLPISYKIVQEHKGTIKVKSSVGMGTEFRISFPAL